MTNGQSENTVGSFDLMGGTPVVWMGVQAKRLGTGGRCFVQFGGRRNRLGL